MRGMRERVAHYIRVSTEEQRQGWSPDDQIHQLARESERLGEEVVEVIRLDEGYSGADPDRPGLRRMLELAEAGEVDVIRATKRDRLFRSRLYRLLMDQDLEEFGVRLEALNDIGLRVGDGLLDDFAEWEREQITERTMAGKAQKARSGKVVAGPYPVHGFRFSQDRDYYEVDEATMASVRRVFSLIASGETVSGTARKLQREGFPAPRGKVWLRAAIREIVFDDAYRSHSRAEIEQMVSEQVATSLTEESYGVWHFGRRKSVKTRRGRRVRERPKEEWIAVPIPDAGIPLEQVEAARASLSRNERNPKSTAAGREWELSGGVLRCGGCGRAMIAVASSTYHALKSGERKRYVQYTYRCNTAHLSGPEACPVRPRRSFAAGKVERAVWKVVRDAMLDPESLVAALEKTKPRKEDRRRLEAITERLAELERRRDGLVDLAADGDISRQELREKLPPLDAQISALKSDAEALRKEREKLAVVQEDFRLMLSRRKAQAPGVLDSLDAKGRWELYRDLDLKVIANPDRTLTLTWLAGLDLGTIRRKGGGYSARTIGCTPNIRFRVTLSASGEVVGGIRVA